MIVLRWGWSYDDEGLGCRAMSSDRAQRYASILTSCAFSDFFFNTPCSLTPVEDAFLRVGCDGGGDCSSDCRTDSGSSCIAGPWLLVGAPPSWGRKEESVDSMVRCG